MSHPCASPLCLTTLFHRFVSPLCLTSLFYHAVSPLCVIILFHCFTVGSSSRGDLHVVCQCQHPTVKQHPCLRASASATNSRHTCVALRLWAHCLIVAAVCTWAAVRVCLQGFQEQDSHEMLRVLLDGLQGEEARGFELHQPPPYPSGEVSFTNSTLLYHLSAALTKGKGDAVIE